MGEPIAQSGRDFGFGEALSKEKQQRLINRDGSFNVQRSRRRLRDYFSYASILQASWPVFLATVVLSFLIANIFFGRSYFALGPTSLALEGVSPDVPRMWTALFFSVHTFTTIGYGNVVPIGMCADLLVVVESFLASSGTRWSRGFSSQDLQDRRHASDSA